MRCAGSTTVLGMQREIHPRTLRVGAIDMGSNSTRLLIADVAGKVVTECERRLAITRLGQDVDRVGSLAPEARTRTMTIVDTYVAAARAAGATQILATATSAVRDAADGQSFLAELSERFEIETRLLTGDVEARTTFAGVASDTDTQDGIAIIDVGGGSTELVIGSTAPTFARSVQAGCGRMTERHLGEDRVDPEHLIAGRRELLEISEAAFGEAPLSAVATTIAVAGTATTLAALDLGLEVYDAELVHGHVLERETIVGWRDRLAAMSLYERRQLPVIEPGRAPVIVAGALILETVLEVIGSDRAVVSERDILHGIAMLAAEL